MRLNAGQPVWHVSVSVWSRRGAKYVMVDVPELAEREAVRVLRGVGGTREWWLWNGDARVGHLRVGVTDAETEVIPSGIAQHDAGDSGPERIRT